MCQPTHDGVVRQALAAVPTAPVIRLDHAASQHIAVRFKSLVGDHDAEFPDAAKRGQVRAVEGSVRHVEIFRVDGVGPSLIGTPRGLPGHGPTPAATPSIGKSQVPAGSLRHRHRHVTYCS